MSVNFRHTYRGSLARPLERGRSPAKKLPLLYDDLGVSTPSDAVRAMAARHVSGCRRTGPKTRCYPSGPLRWRLKPHESIEDKLPLLMQHFRVRGDEQLLLCLAVVHVPGFNCSSVLRDGGLKRPLMVRRGLSAAQADVDEAWLCEIIDGLLEHDDSLTLADVALYLSRTPPRKGCENPGYGLEWKWIVSRYSHRKRYEQSADKRLERTIERLKKLL